MDSNCVQTNDNTWNDLTVCKQMSSDLSKNNVWEFANCQLKIAHMLLAYFIVGLLLFLCGYLKDWAGYFISPFVSLLFSLSISEKLKAGSAFS